MSYFYYWGAIIIIILLVIIDRIIAKDVNEGFENFGKYPVNVDKPLLYDSYKLSKDPKVGEVGAADIYVNYPIFPATWSGTNNLKYWRRPTNGQCTPADLCAGLYEATPQDKPYISRPSSWEDPAIRVNFYDSAPSACV